MATSHPGHHVALSAAQRLGHPRPPGLRLGDTRLHQLQPGEERLAVGTRMAVYSADRRLPSASSS
jgi:hypothetical protein